MGTYSFNTKMTTVPSTPDWVMVNRDKKDTVSLTWNPTDGAASYTVFRKKVNRFGFSSGYTAIASNHSGPNYVDKIAPLQSGSHYSYYVTAKNAIGESAKSSEARTDDQASSHMAVPLIVVLTVVIFVIIFSITRYKNKSSRQVYTVDVSD